MRTFHHASDTPWTAFIQNFMRHRKLKKIQGCPMHGYLTLRNCKSLIRQILVCYTLNKFTK